jgi:hypothetical protein
MEADSRLAVRVPLAAFARLECVEPADAQQDDGAPDTGVKMIGVHGATPD